MKSERAEDYLDRHSCGYPIDGYFTYQAAEKAIEIAEEEAEERIRAKLTRWNDAKEMRPARWQEVLLKLVDGDQNIYYRVGVLCTNDHFQYTGGRTGSEIIGWRYIHE